MDNTRKEDLFGFAGYLPVIMSGKSWL